MAKGRSRRNREAKKPKAAKKPAQASSTFLRPQPAGSLAKAPAKQSGNLIAIGDAVPRVYGEAEQIAGKLSERRRAGQLASSQHVGLIVITVVPGL